MRTTQSRAGALPLLDLPRAPAPGTRPRQHQLAAPEPGRLCGSPRRASADRAGNAEARAQPPQVFSGHSRLKSQGPISLSLPSSQGQPGLLQPHTTRGCPFWTRLQPPHLRAPSWPPAVLPGAQFWLCSFARHCPAQGGEGGGDTRGYFPVFPVEASGCLPCFNLSSSRCVVGVGEETHANPILCPSTACCFWL